jgi:MFS transporter, NNP family, nitrate/nitrite transporter
VVAISLVGAALLAIVIALQPPPELAAGSSFVVMAFALGLGTGGVFAWLARRARPNGSAASPASSAPPVVWAATSPPKTSAMIRGRQG